MYPRSTTGVCRRHPEVVYLNRAWHQVRDEVCRVRLYVLSAYYLRLAGAERAPVAGFLRPMPNQTA